MSKPKLIIIGLILLYFISYLGIRGSGQLVHQAWMTDGKSPALVYSAASVPDVVYHHEMGLGGVDSLGYRAPDRKQTKILKIIFYPCVETELLFYSRKNSLW